MRKEDRELWNEALNKRLNIVNAAKPGSEEESEAFKEALQMVDRDIERAKAIRDGWIRVAEIGATAVVAPLVGYATHKGLAKMLCMFEKDYTFTTTAGRALSGLFRFKK